MGKRKAHEAATAGIEQATKKARKMTVMRSKTISKKNKAMQVLMLEIRPSRGRSLTPAQL